MDNQNKPNDPNSPLPAGLVPDGNKAGGLNLNPPPPIPGNTSDATSTYQPSTPPLNPQPPATPPQDLNPAPTWQPPSIPPISTPDIGSTFSTPPPQSPSPWNPPVSPVPQPQPTNPWTPPIQPMPDITPQTPPPPNYEPIPVIPQNPTPTWPQTPSTPSTLDNPWGAPSQPPPIDGGNQTGTTLNIPTQPQEQAPTDLSHLINNSQPETNHPEGEATQPETLVVPSNGSPEVPNIPTEAGHKGIPKWLIGVGIGLLLVVVTASAYFILGIGQSKNSTSVPATQTNQQIKPPAPVATPATTPVVQPSPSTTPTATGSANFGQLGGSAQQATSAGDLLRQKGK